MAVHTFLKNLLGSNSVIRLVAGCNDSLADRAGAEHLGLRKQQSPKSKSNCSELKFNSHFPFPSM